jgi:excisionase family DNA binding protein
MMGITEEERRRLKGGCGGFIEPIAAPIPDVSRVSGLSRSEIYRCLSNGRLEAIKSGSRTLILMDSVRAYLASLPRATFRSPKSAA